MQDSTRTKVLVGLAIVVIAAVAVWWYFGFSLEFMKFFASEPVDEGRPAPTVSCSPSTQTIGINQPVTLTAVNGSGVYEWFSPEGTPGTGSGPTHTVSYGVPGIKQVTIQSAQGTGSALVNSVACEVIVINLIR